MILTDTEKKIAVVIAVAIVGVIAILGVMQMTTPSMDGSYVTYDYAPMVTEIDIKGGVATITISGYGQSTSKSGVYKVADGKYYVQYGDGMVELRPTKEGFNITTATKDNVVFIRGTYN